MSIWSKPIFGTHQSSTPASPVAIRCAAIRSATDLRAMPAMFTGYLLGKGLSFWLLIIGTTAFGVAPLPFLDSMRALLTGMGPAPFVITAGVIAFFWIVFPFLVIKLTAHRAPKATREHLWKLRKTRRHAPRIMWGLAAFFMLLMAATTFRGLPTVCIGGSSLAAAVGGALVGFGLTARRGRTIVCGKCRYPMGSWRAAADRCPECACAWKQPYKARCGSERRLAFVAYGAGLLLLSGVLNLILQMSR